MRVRVSDSRAFTNGAGSILRLAPYFPPEADALRIRLKVVGGQISIFVGGPTAYYANSDVFTEPQTIRAKAKPEWIDVICDFNHPTWRNFRRSGFSTDAPRNYYSRWAQEPMGLFLAPDSLGECLIDRIELVTLGEGKPFAVFPPAQIQPVKLIADFEDGKHGTAFNLYMAAAETEWFEESWTRAKPLRFEPMQIAVTDTGLDGGTSILLAGAGCPTAPPSRRRNRRLGVRLVASIGIGLFRRFLDLLQRNPHLVADPEPGVLPAHRRDRDRPVRFRTTNPRQFVRATWSNRPTRPFL